MMEQEHDIRQTDMEDHVKHDAIRVIMNAFKAHKVEREIAHYIKKEFDKLHGGVWHCIVGRNFGSLVSHEASYFLYMYVGSVAILLFRTS